MVATARRVPLWYLVLTTLALMASVALFRASGFVAQVLACLIVLSCLAVGIHRRVQE
jgi:hypothetical protein